MSCIPFFFLWFYQIFFTFFYFILLSYIFLFFFFFFFTNLTLLFKDFLKDFIQVNIGSMELTANHNITQLVEVCSDFEKRTKLINHLDIISAQNAKVLIFVGTKRVADDITKYLRQDGWPALSIHGYKEQ